MPNTDDFIYDCTNIDLMAKHVGDFSRHFLSEFENAGAAPIANQHVMLALAALNQAESFLALARLHQLQGQ